MFLLEHPRAKNEKAVINGEVQKLRQEYAIKEIAHKVKNPKHFYP